MTFANSWQEGRHEVRCPCCNKLICTEPAGSKAKAVKFFPINPGHAITAQTLTQCRCKNLLEIQRPAA
jgi:hypothetical protein